MAKSTKKKSNTIKTIGAYILFMIVPFIALLILSAITKINPFHLDAWSSNDSAWNDEIGYYNAVKAMRLYGKMPGVPGYNEVEALKTSFGPYNPFTYMPYVVFSFVTGIGSHNFMIYCNVLMMLVAGLLFLLLVRPDIRTTMALILFSLSSLMVWRFTWSGMSECNIIMMMVIVLGITHVLSEEEKEERMSVKNTILMGIMILLILFYGIIRPYLLALILFPLFLIFLKKHLSKIKKVIFSVCLILFSGASFGLYQYMVEYHCTKFFQQNGMSVSELLSQGPVGIVLYVGEMNRTAIQFIIEDFTEGSGWIGAVMLCLLLELILLFVFFIHELWLAKREHDRLSSKGWICFLFGMITIAVYEATIVLYTVRQCHRMMLAFLFVTGLCICLYGEWKNRVLVVLMSVVVLSMEFFIPQNLEGWYVPTSSAQQSAAFEQMQSELAAAIPGKGEDAWDNTVLEIPYNSQKILYCLPDYVTINSYDVRTMSEKIDQNDIRSKYILIYDKRGDMARMCMTKYKSLWENEDFILFQIR